MTNYVQEGDRLQVVAPSGGINSSDVVVVGSNVTVAVTGGLEGETVVVSTCGVYDIVKATGAVVKGDLIYWDAVAGKVTTAVKPIIAGYAFAASASGDATARVKLSEGNSPKAANVAASVASTVAGVVVDLNLVIAALKAAGLMTPDA